MTRRELQIRERERLRIAAAMRKEAAAFRTLAEERPPTASPELWAITASVLREGAGVTERWAGWIERNEL